MGDFDEMIIDAAKSIATATSSLIKAASGAQRELVAQGKFANSVFEDGFVANKRIMRIVLAAKNVSGNVV